MFRLGIFTLVLKTEDCEHISTNHKRNLVFFDPDMYPRHDAYAANWPIGSLKWHVGT